MRELIESLPMLRRFATRLTRSQDAADDLVQEACERALSHKDEMGIERIDLWMRRVILNLWADRQREGRRAASEALEAANDIIGCDGQLDAECRVTLAEVRRALGTLPAEQQTIMILVCVDGLSYREAAKQLGIPLGTVMSRLARGRLALMKSMRGRSNIALWRASR